MAIYFVSVITLNIVCFMFILLSGIQHKKRYYYSLAIMNLLLVVYLMAFPSRRIGRGSNLS